MIQSTYLSIILIILQSHIAKIKNTKPTDNLNWKYLPSDARLNFTSLATKYGHPAEQLDVVTEDGYILTIFHLFGKSPIPVLLLHGILDSADTWIIRGNNSLAITLANNGYDVWVANSRGNKYSRRHKYFNPDKDAVYWKYSFHELGYYDLPAIIDKVLKETGALKLSAIAHSQGTTAFFVLGSTRPEYNKKINIMIALGPVCYLHHSPPPISNFIKLALTIEDLFLELQINEFLSDTAPATQILRTLCSAPIVGYEICAFGFLFPFTGWDPEELEPSFYSISATHFPSGTSSRSLVHYLQVGNRKIFAPFDNGPDMNKVMYNSTIPPPYDFGKVSMPIALLAARNDFLSTLPDVALLKNQLPNVVFYLVNPRKLYNHLDHVIGKHMHVYLFPYIFELLHRYNGYH